MNENYAIRVLKTELRIIKEALSNWDEEKYKEAKEMRNKYVKQLEEAINLIEKK